VVKSYVGGFFLRVLQCTKTPTGNCGGGDDNGRGRGGGTGRGGGGLKGEGGGGYAWTKYLKRHQTLNVVFNKVYRLKIQLVMLVFSIPLVN
jgi:hypothetical protein